ncbi:MAG: cache domain-containing protein [Rhizobiales bacterium]|nr:cache domain-containing protein [Hyphomicrobiales bacterium]
MIILAGLFGALFWLFAGAALAQDSRGTADEAKAMVAKAIAAFDAEGTAAFAAMTAPSKTFVDRDLYVFVFDKTRLVAHGFDATLIGGDAASLADVNGKKFGVEFIEKATPDGAWVDYVWRDPISGKDVAKSSWVVSHKGYVFGTGIYKP